MAMETPHVFGLKFPRLERLSWEQKRWSLEAGEKHRLSKVMVDIPNRGKTLCQLQVNYIYIYI